MEALKKKNRSWKVSPNATATTQLAVGVTLKKHQAAIHEGVKHKCDICGKQFTHKSAVAQHKKSVHDGKECQCTDCDYQAISTHMSNQSI